MKAVNHARDIEKKPKFKNNLQITTKLTSHKLTILHEFTGYGIFFIVIGAGLFFAVMGSSFIDSLDEASVDPMSQNPEIILNDLEVETSHIEVEQISEMNNEVG